VDDLSVFGVDLGHDHRNVGCAAVGRVVGYDRALGFRISFFKRFDLIFLHIYRTEHEIDLGRDSFNISGIHDDHVLDVLRDRSGHRPSAFYRLLIGLSRGTLGCCDCGYMKPRMIGKQQRESLTHHTRDTDDSNVIRFHIIFLQIFKKQLSFLQ